MDWLIQQAQSANSFISVFCLFGLGLSLAVNKLLWNQLLFERGQHRLAEAAFAEIAKEMAVSSESLSGAVDHLTNGAIPALVKMATEKAPRR